MDGEEMIGKTFGRLIVFDFGDTTKQGFKRWDCVCSCGATKRVLENSLTRGLTKSCGCYRKEVMDKIGERSTTHGKTSSSEYSIWCGMKSRCANLSDKDYGGRGIKVCARWSEFENFLSDMGERPSNTHQIDRINNDGDYEPDNCRWATPTTNGRNTRKNNNVTYNELCRPVSEWAEILNINYGTLYSRLFRQKWSVEIALGGTMVNLNNVVKAYTETREEIKNLTDEIDKLKEFQARREEWLRGELEKQGLQNAKTEFGSVFRTLKESVTVGDADALFGWVAEPAVDAAIDYLYGGNSVTQQMVAGLRHVIMQNLRFEFLNKAANKTAVLELMTDKRDVPPPPGVNYSAVRTVGVRKA